MSQRQIDACLKHFYGHKIKNPVIYEFGVYRGSSIDYYIKREPHFQIRASVIYGFDSFVGLPEEDPNSPMLSDFPAGKFNLTQENGLDTLQNIELIRETINDDRLVLIPGFYSELSKKHARKHRLLPADLVYLDADLYISTIQALNFLHNNRLLKYGTLLAYDQFAVPSVVGLHGEEKAHWEFLDKTGTKCDISFEDNNGMLQKTFVISEYTPKQYTRLEKFTRFIHKLFSGYQK